MLGEFVSVLNGLADTEEKIAQELRPLLKIQNVAAFAKKIIEKESI